MRELGKELKLLSRHGATYGAAEILSRVVSFLMIPVFTHYLKPADYGVNELVGITAEVIGLVVGFGLADAIYRFYYDKEAIWDPKIVISTACLGVAVASSFILGALFLVSKYIASLVLEGREQWIFISLALGTVWFNQQFGLVCTYLRVKERSGTYFFLSLGRVIMGLSLSIYFVAFLGWGVLGVFLSGTLTAAFFSLISFPILMKKVGFKFSFTLAKQMLRFSVPVIPANLASLVVNVSDRYFIRGFLSIADVGIYSLGYKLGNVVFYLVRVPFMQIWAPRSLALYKEGASREIYAKIATYFTGLMIFCGLGISVFVQDVIKIISPREYWSAAIFTPAVVLSYIIYALDNHVGFGIVIAKKTEYWTYVNLVMGGLNIVLNFILIPRYGMWGAVWGTSICLIFKVGSLYIIGRRFYEIPFEWSRMGGMLSVAIGIYFLSIILHPNYLITSLAFDGIMVLAFLPVLWITGLIYSDEKEGVMKLIRKYFNSKSLEAIRGQRYWK
jgi:O-antigen/teichoic acid export membrane protein